MILTEAGRQVFPCLGVPLVVSFYERKQRIVLALLELSGDAETACDIYDETCDIHELPPPEARP